MEKESTTETLRLSLFSGPVDPPLLSLTLADFLDEQCTRFGDHEFIVTPWNGARWTYDELRLHSIQIARYLLTCEVRPGDRVAILAGNRAEYASVFFACMRLGAVLVILNNTYTAQEAFYAIRHTESKVLFASSSIGRNDQSSMLQQFNSNSETLPALRKVIILDGEKSGFVDYEEACNLGSEVPEYLVKQVQATVNPYDTCNLQFTSGSTGSPKAAMLTHYGLLNNSRFIGDRMQLTPSDVLCCPPPLFHCFGLVLGLLAVLTHGAKIVYPSDVFDGPSVLEAITEEQCTALHGVPAMFDILFSIPRPTTFDCSALRTGIIAGAPVPRQLMIQLVEDFGMTEFTSSYGLTEASPTCFNSFVDDSIPSRLSTVGTLMPHAHAKIVDKNGNIVPIGTRGELCMAGYQIQRGYWRNPAKTDETMKKDRNGIVWLHTGDEAVFDRQGYCSITGRFKDIIIRGGENIYPLEIEERLTEHPSVERAIVVGLPDRRYQEVVAAFLERKEGAEYLADDGVRQWIRATHGRHKAPVYIFWLGRSGVPKEIPVTGSGKIKKFEYRRIGAEMIQAFAPPKL